jgi:hypothetical protein
MACLGSQLARHVKFRRRIGATSKNGQHLNNDEWLIATSQSAAPR